MCIPCKISHKDQLQALVDQTHEQLGQIDILVCNAAVNPHYGPLSEIPDSAFEKVLHCNITSNHWLCQMVLPEMRERKDGSIIIVSSVGAYRGSTAIGTYHISNAADLQLRLGLVQHNGPFHIQRHRLSPRPTEPHSAAGPVCGPQLPITISSSVTPRTAPSSIGSAQPYAKPSVSDSRIPFLAYLIPLVQFDLTFRVPMMVMVFEHPCIAPRPHRCRSDQPPAPG